MKVLAQVVFWSFAAILVIPAIVGAFAGAVVFVAALLAVFLIMLAALALVLLSCIPIIWWCGMWESINTQQWLLGIKQALKQQPKVENQ